MIPHLTTTVLMWSMTCILVGTVGMLAYNLTGL